MPHHFPVPRGTILNTATVAIGGFIGWRIGSGLPQEYERIAMSGLGLVTIGLGIKMFLEARHLLVIAGAIAFGGMLGIVFGLQHGIDAFAEWAKNVFGGQHAGRFDEAVVTTSILFCIGPMTMLGCLQDGLEGKIELLAIKSTMDGIGAMFFAAALGPGVLVTAGVLLVFQSALTFLAHPLRRVAQDTEMLSEITGAGGVMLMGTGLGLLNLAPGLSVISYLPALALAPFAVFLMRKWPLAKRTKVLD